mmetsp:Transcript_58091/g.87561  ORF Transcript_58091/g.87561 Transcript_58091/m.87561 type:complete len:219 (-) Transcript_58091:263-919(-)
MRTARNLNVLTQLFVHEMLEFAGTKDPGVVMQLHKGLVLGRVSDQPPGVGDSQDIQIVLQGVAYQNAVLQELQNEHPTGVQGHRGGLEVLGGDARDKGAVVRDGLGLLNVLVQKDLSVPVDDGDSSGDAGVSSRSNADHFTVKGGKLGRRRCVQRCHRRRLCLLRTCSSARCWMTKRGRIFHHASKTNSAFRVWMNSRSISGSSVGPPMVFLRRSRRR